MKNKFDLPKIFPVTCHTDHVGPRTTFVAINGYKEDGVNYIPLALEKGASTILIQKGAKLSAEIQKKITEKEVRLEYVENPRKTLAYLSAKALNYPTRHLNIIGITGTKGKTTTAWLIEHILKEAGYKTARIGSDSYRMLDIVEQSSLTTPPADYLQHFFYQCVKKGVKWVVIEVAAQALALDRIAGIEFDGIIFTNFESEHLEFFKEDNNYFKAKLKLFKQLKPEAPAFVNIDNTWCATIPSMYPFVKRFGLDNTTLDITALVDLGWEYRLNFTVPWKERKHRLMCPGLVGRFNAYNIIGAIGLSLELGIPMETIAAALYTFSGIPGRQDWYTLPNGAQCIIDYAHTATSYEAILSLLRLLTDHLIVVFGAGGDRDRNRRPRIGSIAAQYADLIILTAENPRSENPEKIIDDILMGISLKKRHGILHEVDRTKAINKAYQFSRQNSIIAILGKGVEEYQIVGNKKIPFSDQTIIQSI